MCAYDAKYSKLSNRVEQTRKLETIRLECSLPRAVWRKPFMVEWFYDSVCVDRWRKHLCGKKEEEIFLIKADVTFWDFK